MLSAAAIGADGSQGGLAFFKRSGLCGATTRASGPDADGCRHRDREKWSLDVRGGKSLKRVSRRRSLVGRVSRPLRGVEHPGPKLSGDDAHRIIRGKSTTLYNRGNGKEVRHRRCERAGHCRLDAGSECISASTISLFCCFGFCILSTSRGRSKRVARIMLWFLLFWSVVREGDCGDVR